MIIKGVILAGGSGSRLHPLTKTTNKHLLPVGGKPMLQHNIEKLSEAGLEEILIVTVGEHLGAIAEFCGSGKEFGCKFTYKVQDEAGGIAQALALAEGFINPGEYMCVILGDNIFEDSLKSAVVTYSGSVEHAEPKVSAKVMLKVVEDPGRFGVADIALGEDKDQQNRSQDFCGHTAYINGIEEKPENPKSKFAVTGIYFYPYSVFEIISYQRPSDRGEMEITDVNNEYIKRRELICGFWDGWWTDAGTPASYRKANELVDWHTD